MAWDAGQTQRNVIIQLHSITRIILDAEDEKAFAARDDDKLPQAQWQDKLGSIRGVLEHLGVVQDRALQLAVDAAEDMGKYEKRVNESADKLLSIIQLILDAEQGRNKGGAFAARQSAASDGS